MSEHTGIAWTDHTFNPWWGCAHVSPGCVNCYAETLAKRYGHDVWGKLGPRRTFGKAHWAMPRAWNAKAEHEGRRRRVFCASMADVFEDHPAVKSERERLWELVDQTPYLDWQILTKRPENAAGDMIPWDGAWPRNVWLGSSAEDQRRWDERIPALAASRAYILFVSAEPLLGPIFTGAELWSIDWLIIGGESGPRRRSMNLDWLESLAVDACSANIPVFVKQDGHRLSGQQGRIPDSLWALKQFPITS